MLNKFTSGILAVAILFYLASFIVLFTGLFASDFFGVKLFAPGVMGITMLVVPLFQIVWGLVAGVVDNRRGWSVFEKTRTMGNLVGLVVMNGLITVPSVIAAMHSRRKYGKFLPSPTEC